MPAPKVAQFRGAVTCARTPHGPLGLTLSGRTADHPGEAVTCAFAGTAPAGLPERLEDAAVEQLGPGEFRITSAAGAWPVAARSVHLHRDVAEGFYRAIPAQPAPLRRRVLFRVMLGMARTRVGIALFRALRR